jgi:hypothetical protein
LAGFGLRGELGRLRPPPPLPDLAFDFGWDFERDRLWPDPPPLDLELDLRERCWRCRGFCSGSSSGSSSASA